jgi:hypothetical protein
MNSLAKQKNTLYLTRDDLWSAGQSDRPTYKNSAGDEVPFELVTERHTQDFSFQGQPAQARITRVRLNHYIVQYRTGSDAGDWKWFDRCRTIEAAFDGLNAMIAEANGEIEDDEGEEDFEG